MNSNIKTNNAQLLKALAENLISSLSIFVKKYPDLCEFDSNFVYYHHQVPFQEHIAFMVNKIYDVENKFNYQELTTCRLSNNKLLEKWQYELECELKQRIKNKQNTYDVYLSLLHFHQLKLSCIILGLIDNSRNFQSKAVGCVSFTLRICSFLNLEYKNALIIAITYQSDILLKKIFENKYLFFNNIENIYSVFSCNNNKNLIALQGKVFGGVFEYFADEQDKKLRQNILKILPSFETQNLIKFFGLIEVLKIYSQLDYWGDCFVIKRSKDINQDINEALSNFGYKGSFNIFEMSFIEQKEKRQKEFSQFFNINKKQIDALFKQYSEQDVIEMLENNHSFLLSEYFCLDKSLEFSNIITTLDYCVEACQLHKASSGTSLVGIPQSLEQTAQNLVWELENIFFQMIESELENRKTNEKG